MTSASGRAAVAEFISVQEAASDGEHLVQLCVVDHEASGHLHLQAHFSGSSISPWEQVNRVTVADVRECLRTLGRTRTVRIHLHGEERKNPPAASDIVEALPRVILSADATSMLARGDGDENVCNICLEEYETGAELMVMPCRGLHKFHAACMLTWLQHAGTCPCCQWVVPADSTKAQIAALMAPAQAECARLAAALPPPCQPSEQGSLSMVGKSSILEEAGASVLRPRGSNTAADNGTPRFLPIVRAPALRPFSFLRSCMRPQQSRAGGR